MTSDHPIDYNYIQISVAPACDTLNAFEAYVCHYEKINPLSMFTVLL